MPQPFWELGELIGKNFDNLLPDVSTQNVLPDRWAFEVIYMAGWRVPGLVEIDFSREHRVDKRGAPGQDGEAITSLGYKAGDIKIKIRIWTPQQWIDFQNITIPAVQPRPGKANARPRAVTVEHPSLAAWGVSKLFVTHVAGPRKTPIPQMMEIILTASENAPQVSVPTITQRGGGVASAPNALAGKPPTPPLKPPSQRINTPTTGQ